MTDTITILVCRVCKCAGKGARLIQMKVPGTANTYDPKDRRTVCKQCRKTRDYRGLFRLVGE